MHQDEDLDEEAVRGSEDAFPLAADSASQQNSEMHFF